MDNNLHISQGNISDLPEIKLLLDNHYIGYIYSIDTLKWCMSSESDPYIILLRDGDTLVGCIETHVHPIRIKNVSDVTIIYVDFLCLHPSIRNGRNSKLLITKLVELVSKDHSQFIALFNGNSQLTNMIASTNLYERYIDFDKMQELNMFKSVGINARRQQKRKYNVVEPQFTMRRIEEDDIPLVTNMLNEFHNKYDISMEYDDNITRTRLMNKCVQTYVDDSNLISLSSIKYYEGNVKVKKCILVEFIANTISKQDLLNYALWQAKETGHITFIMNKIADIDDDLVTNLKFKKIDLQTHYYLFEYNTQEIPKRYPCLSIGENMNWNLHAGTILSFDNISVRPM